MSVDLVVAFIDRNPGYFEMSDQIGSRTASGARSKDTSEWGLWGKRG